MSLKTYCNWSSGKDAALALYYAQKEHPVDLLLTTINKHYSRVTMHGLRESLLDAQAATMGIKLEKLYLPENPSMEAYNHLMQQKMDELKSSGYQQAIFGDIFLEDLKKYRDELLTPYDINPLYPIWKKDTANLINEFVDLEFKAIIICINHELLDESFLGQTITKELIDALPPGVDPCGENGEFHTFCYHGPVFKQKLAFRLGEKVFRKYPDPTQKGGEIEFGFIDVLST